jgi:cell division initiation protein
MKVTPEEIRNYSFSKSFRGYDKESVDQFLSSLSQEWQKENEEVESLKIQLEKTEKELNRLKEVETVMFKAMKEADDNAANVLAEATAKAANIVGNAQTKADNYFETKRTDGDNYLANAEITAKEIIEKARIEKAQLLSDANETIEKLKTEAQIEIESSEKEYNSLDIAKQQLLYDLKSLLGSTNDRLENVQTKYSPDVFDAKKATVNQITKATVEVSVNATPVAEPKVKATKATEKKAVASVKIATKNILEKKPKVPVKSLEIQKEMEPEDDGLPTVQKILALTEELHLPTVEPIEALENTSKLPENKSFFDSI